MSSFRGLPIQRLSELGFRGFRGFKLRGSGEFKRDLCLSECVV
jgi:hypothetical protein